MPCILRQKSRSDFHKLAFCFRVSIASVSKIKGKQRRIIISMYPMKIWHVWFCDTLHANTAPLKMSPFSPLGKEPHGGHSEWDHLRPTESVLAWAMTDHSKWDHISPLWAEPSDGHSDWDRLRPTESSVVFWQNLATQNETVLATLRPFQAKWDPKWPSESFFPFHSVRWNKI